MNITMSQLAELKQVSKAAVSKKVKLGKLDAAMVIENGKKKFNRDIALKLWESNTDPVNQIVQQKVNLMDHIEELPVEQIPDFNVSRAKKMHFDAALSEIEVKVKEGIYVDAKETEQKGFEMAKSLSDALMTLPDRVSSLFAAETDQAVIGKTLKDEIILAIRKSIPETV